MQLSALSVKLMASLLATRAMTALLAIKPMQVARILANKARVVLMLEAKPAQKLAPMEGQAQRVPMQVMQVKPQM